MKPDERPRQARTAPDLDEQAAEAYLRCRQGPWTAADQSALEARLAGDAGFAEAFERAGRLWQSVGAHAAKPELMAMREQALARARRSSAGRWRGKGIGRWRIAAAVAAVGIALSLLFAFVDPPGTYRTAIGEQRVVQLDDHSRIVMDAATHLRVRYSDDARVVELYEGQAQFSVARDRSRPFKVQAGNRTVVALGTVFTVEYVDRQMHVAMIEGHVVVLPAAQTVAAKPESVRQLATDGARSSGPEEAGRQPIPVATDGPVELAAGEALTVASDGLVTVASDVAPDVVTAWRRGQVVFDGVPLGEAVRRLNRYSRLQLEIEDPDLATLEISGVFEAGDTRAFADAVQAYLPVTADYADEGTVRFRSRN